MDTSTKQSPFNETALRDICRSYVQNSPNASLNDLLESLNSPEIQAIARGVYKEVHTKAA